MKKYFVVSDIHSFFTLMKEALDKAGFDVNNPDHILIVCGDLLDRGDEPIECLMFVLDLPADRVILIRGNHEDLLDDLIARGGVPEWHDYHNGTIKTYNKIAETNNFEMYDIYKERLVDYAEVGDYIFVHGWVPVKYEMYDYEKGNWRTGNWSRARWLNGMEEASLGNIWENKTIVCGHYHTSWGHFWIEKKGTEFNLNPDLGELADFSPYIAKGIIAIDGCTAYSGKVNCYILEV